MKHKLLFAVIMAMAVVPMSMAQVTITYGLTSFLNERPYQEDRFSHVAIKHAHDVTNTRENFFGIYDGHGGAETSSFLQKHLHNYFADSLSDYITQEVCWEVPLALLAFESAFWKAETYALEHCSDGSTAVAVYVDKHNILHCAWVGDSRAVLESDGHVAFATQDHKPDRTDERRRIKDAGGTIYYRGVWRINGLAVSRSIGDKICKDGACNQIIAVPEYVGIPLSTNNNFLIMASDGLWDVIENDAAVAMVTKGLKHNRSLDEIARSLQKAAIKKGSKDNITISVVRFNW